MKLKSLINTLWGSNIELSVDPKSKKKILLDNHYPKGPHMHINDEELKHEYKNEDQLLNDFEHLIFVHMGVKL